MTDTFDWIVFFTLAPMMLVMATMLTAVAAVAISAWREARDGRTQSPEGRIGRPEPGPSPIMTAPVGLDRAA